MTLKGIVLWEMCTRVAKDAYCTPYSEYEHISFDFQIIILVARERLRPTIAPNIPESLSELIQLCWKVQKE